MADEFHDYIITLDDDPMMNVILEKAVGKRSYYFSSLVELENSLDKLKPLATFVALHLGLSENGLEILPKLKEKWPFSPIIVITGDRNDEAVSNALASGADDFIYKPINPAEVLARMQTRMTELAKREAQEVITLGDLVIDMEHRIITSQGKHQRFLSPTEMGLLGCLIAAQGTVVKREAMKKRCWGQIFVSDNALNRKLHEVRRILKELSTQVNIRTLYGTGFLLEVKDQRNQFDRKASSLKKTA